MTYCFLVPILSKRTPPGGSIEEAKAIVSEGIKVLQEHIIRMESGDLAAWPKDAEVEWFVSQDPIVSNRGNPKGLPVFQVTAVPVEWKSQYEWQMELPLQRTIVKWPPDVKATAEAHI